jgi:hypothetical protein
VRLEGPGTVSAPPLAVGTWLILGFEGKTLQAYRDLP